MGGTTSAVRNAVLGDAEAISALQARSWQRAYRGIAPDEYLDGLRDDSWLERWRSWLGQPRPEGVHHLVGTVDDRPVTIGSAGPATGGGPDITGQLYVLYTDPDQWGRGHGAAVLRAIHQRLTADGHARAQLWVAATNQRSIAFYEHLGWALDGTTQQEELNGITLDEARMVRNLT